MHYVLLVCSTFPALTQHQQAQYTQGEQDTAPHWWADSSHPHSLFPPSIFMPALALPEEFKSEQLYLN